MQEFIETKLRPLLLIIALWHGPRLIGIRVKVMGWQVKIICATMHDTMRLSDI